MKTISIKVTGRVQGVFYRKSTVTKAKELGVTGWVKNEDDGSVHIKATAENNVLQKLIEWCKVGPDRAVVTTVEVMDLPYEAFDNFETR